MTLVLSNSNNLNKLIKRKHQMMYCFDEISDHFCIRCYVRETVCLLEIGCFRLQRHLSDQASQVKQFFLVPTKSSRCTYNTLWTNVKQGSLQLITTNELEKTRENKHFYHILGLIISSIKTFKKLINSYSFHKIQNTRYFIQLTNKGSINDANGNIEK